MVTVLLEYIGLFGINFLYFYQYLYSQEALPSYTHASIMHLMLLATYYA